MTLGALLDNLLLLAACAALAAAALRLAGRLSARPLPRVLCAAAIFAAMAVIESLGLGLGGLGGSPLALLAAAVLTWGLGRAVAPPPPTEAAALARAAAASWSATPLAVRLLLGAAGGLIAAAVLTQLHRPLLGQDAVTYHLPEVVAFVQSGHPGRVVQDFYGLPVGNYPLTEELLLSWVTGLAHGFPAAILATVAMVGLLLAGGWLGLGELSVARPPAILALAALALNPLIVQAALQPGTDLPTLAWVVVGAALCLSARREPALLAGAVVCFGLAVGTKTTALPWSVAIGALTAWHLRGTLREHRRTLVAAGLLAVLSGLLWYLRNLLDHGSPLWPFLAAPWGTPEPELLRLLHTTLLQTLHGTLLVHLGAYAHALSGAVVLLLGGALIALLAAAVPPAAGPAGPIQRGALPVRRRRLLAAAAVVMLGAVAYAASPLTGLPAHQLWLFSVVGSTVRYLLLEFAAGACALALVADDPRRPVAALGVAALVGALSWDLASDLHGGFFLAFSGWLAPGALIGLALVALAPAARRSIPRPAPALAVAVVGGLVAFGLAQQTGGFLTRHALAGDFDSPAAAFLAAQPGFATGTRPVFTAPTGFGPLTGDRLNHPISLIPVRAPCAQVITDARRGWVVLNVLPPTPVRIERGTAAGCLSGLPARFVDGTTRVYALAR